MGATWWEDSLPSLPLKETIGCPSLNLWKYVHVPGNKREKLDAKAVEGHFVGLPQNRKGYMASDSWNLLEGVCFSWCNICWDSRDLRTSDDPGWWTSAWVWGSSHEQCRGEIGKREDSVVEGDARQKSGAGGATETTAEGAPTQLRQSIRIKCFSPG